MLVLVDVDPEHGRRNHRDNNDRDQQSNRWNTHHEPPIRSDDTNQPSLTRRNEK